MFVLLHFEGFVLFLQYNGDDHIGSLIIRVRFIFIGVVFDIKVIGTQGLVCFDVVSGYALFQLLSDCRYKLSLFIYRGHLMAAVIFHRERRNAILFGHTKVIGTKRG